eukprot:CAMPEP_0201868734 /NCGR_PEP_ID=MMETSP0902-20130614/2500_1 /ASSEMBLY_ACC=CAM_ASM_000551 /TAXON_ID=420261 /ORGANISM="Thalassiosira antarctica, Strain CCMP982" /LENGTH=459 /DNA_ID=CAMNT_0048394107 /DNA_START=217 /DNA_END=1593 /DNA_ORIENTATION=-
MEGKKSRHYRDASDTLLGLYSSNLSSSTPSQNGYYGSGGPTSPPKQPSVTFDKHGDTSSPPKNKKKKERGGYRVHRVSYTAQNHVQVLFRTYASAFPQVIPFVCANVVWTLCVYYMKRLTFIDLTFHSSVGHSFMGLLVSFLIVSRSQISYARFMEYRRHLAASYQACRELAQYTTVYTFQTQTEDAAWWRQEVSFRIILLLRVTMDALLWSSTEREKWEDEYFKFNREQDGDKEDSRVSKHFLLMKQLSHGRRSFIDENFRAPVNFAHILRQVIMEHPHYLGYTMPTNEYRDLLRFVENFINAFHGFRVLVFTPYPFPLLQMTRAVLFFWVYTLPMVLLKDYRLWSSILIVILVTFGFIGVEYVSMSLDDPFGDDTNDVDEHGMSLLVYEDIYLAIYRTDGPDAAVSLRDRVLDRYRQGRELDCYRDDLKGYDIWEAPEWWFEQKQCDDSVDTNAQCQ